MTNSQSEIERAFSNLVLCTALAHDTDKLVSQAIDWYTCVNPSLSPRKVRQKPRLIKDAVGDYLYIAGCNLKSVVESLPIDCNQDLLAQVAAKHVSELVEQQYPDLPEAMQRALLFDQKPEPTPPWQPFAEVDETVELISLS